MKIETKYDVGDTVEYRAGVNAGVSFTGEVGGIETYTSSPVLGTSVLYRIKNWGRD